MKKLTKEQKDYQKACKKLLKAQQQRDDALGLLQVSCNHDDVVCAYENDEDWDHNDYYEYRVCCDCGYHERTKNKNQEFTLNHSNKQVSLDEFYKLVNR
jgi:Zn ribbon nucleic-acid-binding protein